MSRNSYSSWKLVLVLSHSKSTRLDVYFLGWWNINEQWMALCLVPLGVQSVPAWWDGGDTTGTHTCHEEGVSKATTNQWEALWVLPDAHARKSPCGSLLLTCKYSVGQVIEWLKINAQKTLKIDRTTIIALVTIVTSLTHEIMNTDYWIHYTRPLMIRNKIVPSQLYKK